MADLEWFSYSGQTTDELLALEGKYRTDSLAVAFEEAVMGKPEDDVSDEELVILIVEALEREVNNGGYSQFFLNTSEFAPVAVDALMMIGCDAVAALTQEAIDFLAIPGEVTPDAIDDVIAQENEARDEALAKCDKKYFANAGDLSGPLLEFIKKNRGQIEIGV